MKFLLLFLALAGVSSGLQAPLHYKYEYFGSVNTGIPEMNNQASGWAVKAIIEVHVEKNDGNAVFEIHDFRTAIFNEKLGCDARGEIADHLFVRPEDEHLVHAVESPFKVHFFDHDDYTVEDEANEYLWLTNMRKGIALIFHNEILRANIDHQIAGSVSESMHKGNIINIFSVHEETIFGNCKVDYTIYPVPEYYAGHINAELGEHIGVDIQKGEKESDDYKSTKKTTKKSPKKSTKKGPSKTSKQRPSKYRTPEGPELKDDLWHVTRSVDFDHCDEMVAMQLTPVGIDSPVTTGQHKWSRSRSSVSEFYFRGSAGHVRMEKAIVEGATTIAPLGFQTELLQARVNQTLYLISVTAGEPIPTMPEKLKQSHTWMQEVYSFAEEPKISLKHPWVIFTGQGHKIGHYQTFGVAPFTPDDIQTLVKNIIEIVKTAAHIVTDLDQEVEGAPVDTSGFSAHQLKIASEYFRHLNKEEIIGIFDKIFEKDLLLEDTIARKLVIDAAAASGSHAAYLAILDYIKQEKIPELQIMTIFMTLANNAECPLALNDIMEYVISIDMKEKPFLAATALINFAEIVHEMCIHPLAKNIHYAGPLYGDSSCDRETLKARFLPFLKNIIYNAETTWEKDVAIQTLHVLGVPFAFPILAPIIEGKVKCSTRVRSLAIHALESWKYEGIGDIRKGAMDLLTDIYSDIGEDAEVREAALLAIISWKPEASFWHRLAHLTWREPSRQFASFATSIIESMAHSSHETFLKQHQAASHALPFARPIAPVLKYSFVHMMSKRLVDRHVSKFEMLSWESTERSFYDKEVYYYLMTNLGGFEIDLMEVYGVTDGFFKEISGFFQEKQDETTPEGAAAKIAAQFYDRIQDTIHAKKIDHHDHPNIDLFVKVFDHMNLFLPINRETIVTLPISDRMSIATLLIQLGMGQDILLNKFVVPIDLKATHPTELGLNLFSMTSTPILFSSILHATIGFGGQSLNLESHKKMEMSFEELTRISYSASTTLQVLLPYNGMLVGTGIRATREVTAPLNSVIRKDEKNEGGLQRLLHTDIHSLYKKKFSILKAENMPFTSVEPIFIKLSGHPSNSFKLLTDYDVHEKQIHLGNAYTGLDFDIHWSSELEFPFAFSNIRQFLTHPDDIAGHPWLLYAFGSPTLKYWSFDLEFHPETSKTKNITIEFLDGIFGKKEAEQITQETGDEFSQYGQDAFEQYDQESFDVSQGFQEIDVEPEASTSQIGYDDTLLQKSEKLQDILGGSVVAVSMKIEFDGENKRMYEFTYSYARSKLTEGRKVKKSHISLVRSPIPHVDEKPASICLDVKKSLPDISELDTVQSLINSDADNKHMEAQITLGCKGEPVFSLEASYKVSDIWKDKLQKTLPEVCDFHHHSEAVEALLNHIVYDDVKYDIKWEKVRDEKHFPVTSKIFDAAERFLLAGAFSSAAQDKHLEIDVHRCPESGNWHIDGKQEDDTLFHFGAIQHNCIFSHLYSVGPKHEYHEDSFHKTTFNLESEQCSVGTEAVRTFDGFEFKYESSECWTVAAMDCESQHGWMLLVRHSAGEAQVPDAKYIDVKRGLVIEYVKGVMKINGKIVDPISEKEVIRGEHGETDLIVHKKNGFMMAQFGPDFFFTAKDTIRVHIPKNKWGSMCGLCGNHDGEPLGELIGPHRCTYSSPNLFAASWTAGGDSCDPYALIGLREPVEKFQKTCKSYDEIHTKCPHFNERCFHFGWMVVKDEENHLACVSDQILKYCDETCDYQQSHKTKELFVCWPIAKAPTVLTEALNNKQTYLTTPISEEPHFHDKWLYVDNPDICKKY